MLNPRPPHTSTYVCLSVNFLPHGNVEQDKSEGIYLLSPKRAIPEETKLKCGKYSRSHFKEDKQAIERDFQQSNRMSRTIGT